MEGLRISETAELLGVSNDTVRRWIEDSRLHRLPGPGPARVDAAGVAALMRENAPELPHLRVSARNHFDGIVTRVEKDGVMALVELQCGPHRVISLMSREAADDLGLEPGVRASASIKSTNVVIEKNRIHK